MTTNEINIEWRYLEERPQTGLKQLYFKGKKLKAFTVWMDMLVNQESIWDAATNWDLSIRAVEEAIQYCETHKTILEKEALDEQKYLEDRGIQIESKAICR